MPEIDDVYLRANAEANAVFDRLASVVKERVDAGVDRVSVLEVAREAGLELDERVLIDLQLPEFIPVHRFIDWQWWFPWRPIWCWWWRFRYPYYHCCPYWWTRCHWYLG